MWKDNRPPLPDWIQEAYEIIIPHIDDPDEGIPRDRAHEILLAHEEFPNEPQDAEHALDRLLNRGWVYEVYGNIRITDPDWTPD